jgi:hypothetical protein
MENYCITMGDMGMGQKDPGRGLLDVLSPLESSLVTKFHRYPFCKVDISRQRRDVFGIQSIQKRQRIEHVFLFNSFFWM